MLKLKPQYFGHLMQRTDSFEKTLLLGKIKAGGEGDNRGWDGWMASPSQWTWVWVSSEIWWWTGKPGMWQSIGSQRVGQDWATELNWGIEYKKLERKFEALNNVIFSQRGLDFMLQTHWSRSHIKTVRDWVDWKLGCLNLVKAGLFPDFPSFHGIIFVVPIAGHWV